MESRLHVEEFNMATGHPHHCIVTTASDSHTLDKQWRTKQHEYSKIANCYCSRVGGARGGGGGGGGRLRVGLSYVLALWAMYCKFPGGHSQINRCPINGYYEWTF